MRVGLSIGDARAAGLRAQSWRRPGLESELGLPAEGRGELLGMMDLFPNQVVVMVIQLKLFNYTVKMDGFYLKYKRYFNEKCTPRSQS